MAFVKYGKFKAAVKKSLPMLGKGERINPDQLDRFTGQLMADRSFDSGGKIYCRDGFAHIRRLDRGLYQGVALQINSFGEGVFSDTITRFVTPVLMTVRFHNRLQLLRGDFRDCLLSIEEFYLGRDYCGSKGPLCDRDRFQDYSRKLFTTPGNSPMAVQQLVYHLMNANYLCHHIAETAAYAFGAFHNFALHKDENCFLSAGSAYDEARRRLRVDIVSDFSGRKVTSRFSVPQYGKITEGDAEFAEPYDVLEWEVGIEGQKERFLLPSGYQKAQLRKFQGCNVVTSQHMIEYILEDFFKLINIFVTAGTYQTLEYVSRAMVARKEQHLDAFSAYMKTATFCQGYYPDRDLDGVINRKSDQFPEFRKEFFYSMFFRPPVLK